MICLPQLVQLVLRRLSHMQDLRTSGLRLMILWRFLENVVAALAVLWLPAVLPCTPASSDTRYLSDYCVTCCRGPIMYFEFVVFIASAMGLYVLSWVAGWALDNFYFKSNV